MRKALDSVSSRPKGSHIRPRACRVIFVSRLRAGGPTYKERGKDEHVYYVWGIFTINFMKTRLTNKLPVIGSFKLSTCTVHRLYRNILGTKSSYKSSRLKRPRLAVKGSTCGESSTRIGQVIYENKVDELIGSLWLF